MAGACPVPTPGDPLVSSLLGSTDCHVQTLVRAGYGALFEGSGAFSAVLTVLLTVYVALIGYQLLLGRSQLNVSDLALSAVKIGAVVALATQWGTYQTVVYRVLFDGPQEAANVILQSLGTHGAGYGGDVFAGLQHAFDDLTIFSPAAPPGTVAPVAPPPIPPGIIAASPIASSLGPAAAGGAQISALLSKAGFDSLLLLSSALILLLSTLGVLLISKIVLSLLLALGPIFVALFLFDSTRGLFAGWLRASVAFAFAPLSTTLILGLGLTLLAPSLTEVEVMRDTNTYIPGVAFGVLILVIVLAGVSLGLMIAAGFIAGGFKLPGFAARARGEGSATAPPARGPSPSSEPARAERVATAAAALERRDATIFARSAAASAAAGAADERRGASPTPGERGIDRDIVSTKIRLGQSPRRNAQPRAGRALRSEA